MMNSGSPRTWHVLVNGRDHLVGPHRVITIGRDSDADIAYFDPRVSHHHAQIEVGPTGAVELVDLGGPGGTWMDGRRVIRVELVAPVQMRLGHPGDGAPLHLSPSGSARSERSDHRPHRDSRKRQVPAEYSWQAPATRIGRADDNDLVVADLQASRHHAEVRCIESGSWQIVDCHSHNGTFVNGLRTERAPLIDGQRVTIGRTELRFCDGRLEPWPTEPDLVLPALEARGLSVTLPHGQRILDDVSFALEPGKVLAVAGPTGAGKSTLLRALTGFRIPDSGSVIFSGRSLYGEFDELRRTIGYVPQDDILHTSLTIRRALGFGAELRFPADVPSDEREDRVDEVINELGLAARADTPIHLLSGGQRKRTSVALELLSKPRLLFLDEPTSGLDPGYEMQVMEILQQLATGGRAVVVVTHSLQVLDNSDDVLFLAPGGVPAFFGAPQDALAHFSEPSFNRVFSELEASAGNPRRHGPLIGRGRPKPEALVGVSSRPAQPPVPWMRQLSTLARRQVAVVASDRRNLLALAATSLAIAGLILMLTGSGSLNPATNSSQSARSLLGALVTSAAILGAANTIREIVKDSAIYARERAGGLSPVAYLASKAVVFGTITIVQVALVVVIAVARADGPVTSAAGFPPLLELTLDMALIGLAAAAGGLAISALVSNSEKAMALISVVFIVSWLFSGATVDLQSKPVIREIAYISPTNWGFAASASSVGLDDFGPEFCGSTSAAAERCDARWSPDIVHWSTNIAMIMLLALAFLVIALEALSRRDPVRSGSPTIGFLRRLIA